MNTNKFPIGCRTLHHYKKVDKLSVCMYCGHEKRDKYHYDNRISTSQIKGKDTVGSKEPYY